MRNKNSVVMDEKLNPKDRVLLMREGREEATNSKVVKGIDKKGKIDAIDPPEGKAQ